MTIFQTVILLTVFLLKNSQGYPGGAPSTPTVCASLIPLGHTGNTPQKGASPYTVEVDRTEVTGGDNVKLAFYGGIPSTTFKGFLVMAQKLDQPGIIFPRETLGPPQGTFEPSKNAQFLKCDGNEAGAITHTDAQLKQREEVTWNAPNEDGQYVILVTFVKDYKTFWVQQKSETITVKRDDQSEDGHDGHHNPAPDLSGATKKALEEYALGCGKTKGCFGLPLGCFQKSVVGCEMFTTFRQDGQRFIFQIAGKLPTMPDKQGHVSVGLSFDQRMGQDSVTGCVFQNGLVRTKSYYNLPNYPVGKGQNSIMKDENAGLDQTFKSSGKYIDGTLFCEFARTPYLHSLDEIEKNFNLTTDNYYILLARAEKIATNEKGIEKLGYHPGPADRVYSPNTFSLSQVKDSTGSTSGKKEKPKSGDSYKIFPSFLILFIGIIVGQLAF